ncbi:MAG: DUF1643 domain-containing protein, partial [Saprospiraceae bacterium]|nr:DUF1643 domain-containing protein [Saprospiraceae bacterium]
PSRADASYTDPTIRRCIQFAQSWGYGGIIMANLFAFRTPHPEALKQCTKPVGPENDWYIKDALRRSSLTIVAWGNDGRFRQRDKKVLSWIASPMCLRVNKSGQPAHPLYIPAKTTPLPFVLS